MWEEIKLTSKRFKKALKEMLKNGEYDKCIENAPMWERKHLRQLKKILIKSGDIERVPIWALLYEIKSSLLLKDIITYMIICDRE